MIKLCLILVYSNSFVQSMFNAIFDAIFDMSKRGDWFCPQCGKNNFASRNKCFGCGCFRSKADNQNNPTSANTIKSGDWNCTCGELNFASRIVCRKCSNPKNGVAIVNQGDWNCTCGELNFASRIVCRKCQTPRYSDVSRASGVGIASVMPRGSGSIDIRGDISPGFIVSPWFNSTIEPDTHNNHITSTPSTSTPSTITPSTSTPSTSTTNPAVDDSCIVCMDSKKDTVITVCGHLGYCYMCAMSMNKCPICRKAYNPDTQLLKIFNV